MILIGGYYIVILMFDLFIYLIVGNIMSILYLLWCYIVLVLFLINKEVFGNIFFCFIYSIYFFLKNWLKKKKNWYFKVIIIIF